MSRHQAVRRMDLDDELDDFDGDNYDDSDSQEISEEDKEQLREGTIKVREAIGYDVPGITDQAIQDSLWHTFYDVEKTVNYLIGLQTRASEKKAKQAGGKKDQDLASKVSSSPSLSMFSNPSSFAEFFEDTPWLQVPEDRMAVFVAPNLLRGGLLGGSGAPPSKMSKLQAMAAARKRKADEKKADEQKAGLSLVAPLAELEIGGSPKQPGTEPLVASPSELQTRSSPKNPGTQIPLVLESQQDKLQGPIYSSMAQNQHELQPKKRKNLDPHEKNLHISERQSNAQLPEQDPPSSSLMAEPSAFAKTMFSSLSDRQERPLPSRALFTLPYCRGFIVEPTNAFAEPSPDDLVMAAQAKASGKGAKSSTKTKGEKKAAQIAEGVEAMKLDDTPKAKSKNLDVLAEFNKNKLKNSANFVVIGHVDAGKSTMMGRLLYDLKEVDQRTIDRYRKEAENMGKSSFALAWVLDQGSEERSRGVTIDIATNKFSTEKTNFTILDAPGHKDFIPNMIAGASQADFAVLVIDASTGSFESGLKGQTKEHALLVRSMGVQRLIIAVNKLDTVQWSHERFEEISQQLSAFLVNLAGFASKNITFIPVSGLNGDNIVNKSTESSASWYTGPTLVEDLDNSEPVTRALEKPLRITIGDIFRGGIQNPLSVSGRIDAGSLQVGDALSAQPSGEKCFVKGLEAENETVDWAVAGQNVTIHLSDIDPKHLKVGDVLCTPTNPIQCIKQFTAKMLAFEFLTPMGVDVHRNRLHASGKIKELVAVLDKGSGQVIKKKPKIVKPGMVVRVVVELEEAIPLEAPARVILRSGGHTVATGLLE